MTRMRCGLKAVVALTLLGCTADLPERIDEISGAPYTIRQAFANGTYLYGSGTIVPELGRSAGRTLVVWDASNPVALDPAGVLNYHDVEVLAASAQFLFGVEYGTDIDGGGPEPATSAQLVIYSLAMPDKPGEVGRVALPGSELRGGVAASVLNGGSSVFVTLDSGSCYLVDTSAPPAPAVSDSIVDCACFHHVVDGENVHCVSAVGQGSGTITSYGVSGVGTLDLLGQSGAPQLSSPGGVVVDESGTLNVADTAGLVTYQLGDDGGGGTTVTHVVTTDVGTLRSLHSIDATTLLVGTANSLELVTRSGDTYASSFSHPALGSPLSIRPVDAAAGTYVLGAGEYGVLVVRVSAGAIEDVGGYYRRWVDGGAFGNDSIREDCYPTLCR